MIVTHNLDFVIWTLCLTSLTHKKDFWQCCHFDSVSHYFDLPWLLFITISFKKKKLNCYLLRSELRDSANTELLELLKVQEENDFVVCGSNSLLCAFGRLETSWAASQSQCQIRTQTFLLMYVWISNVFMSSKTVIRRNVSAIFAFNTLLWVL